MSGLYSTSYGLQKNWQQNHISICVEESLTEARVRLTSLLPLDLTQHK